MINIEKIRGSIKSILRNLTFNIGSEDMPIHAVTTGEALKSIDEMLDDYSGENGWITCRTGFMPVPEEEVLILTERGIITTAIYEDGSMPEDNSLWHWIDIDFKHDEENDIRYIPEGWWEYRHFNPDEVYNNIVDEKVIAWQPLPGKEMKEEEK